MGWAHNMVDSNLALSGLECRQGERVGTPLDSGYYWRGLGCKLMGLDTLHQGLGCKLTDLDL